MVPMPDRGCRGRAPVIYRAPVLEIPILRLDPDLPLPAYATEGDAGADLVARDNVVLAPRGGRALVATSKSFGRPPSRISRVQPPTT